MKNRYLYTSVALFVAFTFQNCTEETKTTKAETENVETATENHSDGVVELSKEQVKTIGLQWGKVEEKNIGNTIQVTGMLELFPQDKANISPFIGGNVRSIQVIEGDEVEKGQVMAYLEHPDIISMQQEFQEKQNELQFLKQDFERKETLYEQGVSSGKDFQNAESKYRSTQASVNALRAKLKLLGLPADLVGQGKIYPAVPIKTPISGYVDEVMVNLGDYVQPQAKMFSVSDNSKIHLDLKVYEKDIRFIEKGQQIYFTVTSKPDEVLEANIHSIGKTFENEPKALHVHADIDNKNRDLLPGMYVQGHIVQGQQKNTAVPEDALVKNEEGSFIFVLAKNDAARDNVLKFRQINVKTGLSDLGYVAITLPEGFEITTPIVTQGAYALQSEMIKGSISHGH